MTEIEIVLDRIKEAVEDADIAAVLYDFPSEKKYRFDTPVISVGMLKGVGTQPGMYGYMGTRYNSTSDTYTEIYGVKLALTVFLDIRCPADGVQGGLSCTVLFGKTIKALSSLPDGIRIKEISCGDVSYDSAFDMYKCRAELQCDAFVYAEKSDESAEFTDFSLRGELAE